MSVEDILSHGVKKRYRTSKSKPVTSSGKILHDVGKTYPEAASVYAKCFSGSAADRDDYATMQTSSQAERKILWIRVALIEGKLRGIVGEVVKNRRYTDRGTPGVGRESILPRLYGSGGFRWGFRDWISVYGDNGCRGGWRSRKGYWFLKAMVKDYMREH